MYYKRQFWEMFYWAKDKSEQLKVVNSSINLWNADTSFSISKAIFCKDVELRASYMLFSIMSLYYTTTFKNIREQMEEVFSRL